MTNGKIQNYTLRTIGVGVLIVILGGLTLVFFNNFMDNIKTKAEHIALTATVNLIAVKQEKVIEIQNSNVNRINVLETQWAAIQKQLVDIQIDLKTVLRHNKEK